MALVAKTIKISVKQAEWLSRHPEINFSKWVREKIKQEIEKEKRGKIGNRMKAIIVAAGHDNRLEPLTKNIPKCMLDIKGKTILERQIENLASCGIDEVIIIKGYKKETIDIPNIKYYLNPDFETSGILKSLFFAEEELDDNFVFLYSDIIFERRVLEKLVRSNADIALVVDRNWEDHYKERVEHPTSEAELVKVEDNKIVKIGKNIASEDAYGEFIGLAKFSKKGAGALKDCYKNVFEGYKEKEFHEAISIDKAYFTDIIQELIDKGHEVSNIDIYGDWVEIDTFEDYRHAWTEVMN